MSDEMPEKKRGGRGRRLWSLGVGALKLVFAGAIIWGIAFGITVVDIGGSVSESHADIFTWGGPSNQERFTDSLESLGHPEPQVFDLNGNIVYQSVNHRTEDPVRVMRRYQREFANRGLNDEIYENPDLQAINDSTMTRMTGGVAPVRVNEDRIVLGGMLTKHEAESEEELLDELDTERLTSLYDLRKDDVFSSHRWIEIFQEDGSDQTTVLALWSEEGFSYDKMVPQNDRSGGSYSSTDTEVPACPGCTRVNHFADKKDERGYRTNIFTTPSTSEEMVRFYRRAMRQRGWEETRFHQMQQYLSRHVDFEGGEMEKLSFEKGEQDLDVFVYPHSDRDVAVQTVFWEKGDG